MNTEEQTPVVEEVTTEAIAAAPAEPEKSLVRSIHDEAMSRLTQEERDTILGQTKGKRPLKMTDVEKRYREQAELVYKERVTDKRGTFGDNLRKLVEDVKRKPSWADMITTETLTAARQDGEVNVVERVVEILQECGHKNPNVLLNSEHIRLAINANSTAQRVLVNAALMLSCADFADTTRDVRYCLTNTGEIQSWFDNLKALVFPRMIEMSII